MNTDPAETAARLFEKETSSPIAIFFSQSEEDMKVALKQPWVAVCSDSGAVVTMDKGAHPRAYGTFPRVFRYVREEKLITLEDAVRKMTSLAASRAFLNDRGILRAGMKADLVIFDPTTVRDTATFEKPHAYADGFSHIVVNGQVVFENGAMTAARPGRVLYGPGRARDAK